jgi:hypothetical protein
LAESAVHLLLLLLRLAAAALAARASGRAALLTLLTLLTLLALRGLLALLAGFAFLALLLALLAAFAGELFHLAAELFGFAAKHLLGPSLLGKLLLSALLLAGQLLLAAGELFELLHRLVSLLGAFAGRAAILGGFVLVLFRVELEIEQAFEVAQIALAVAATAAAASALEGDLNLTEEALGAEQVLEGALLGRERLLPLLGT